MVINLLRGEVGGLILSFESIGVLGVVGGGVCGVVSAFFLAFLFGRDCGGVGEEEWR